MPNSNFESQQEVTQTNDREQGSLRRKIESALNRQDGFDQALARYGFDSSAEVAQCRDLAELADKIKNNQVIDVMEGPNLYELYRKACRRRQSVAQVMQDVTVLQDPVSRGLRHVRPPALLQVITSELQQEPIRYAKPDSIQSSQSAAAYLKHIYDLATEQITPILEKWALDIRRPDLRQLELSEDNLHQEISTLELVNEVLLSKLFDFHSLTFTGDFGYVLVENTDNKLNIFNNASFTIELWAQVEKWAHHKRFFSQHSNEGLLVAGTDPQGIEFYIRNSSTRVDTSLVLQVPDKDSRWHHYAFVYNKDNKKMEIYQDGVHQQETTAKENCLSTGNFNIGTYGGQRLEGKMSQIRIWNSPRSQQEIRKDMYSVLFGNEPGLMNYWDFSEGSGDKLNDKTERACHGTLQGNNKPLWSRFFPSEASIFHNLKTQLHPLALPFNQELTTVRTGLASIEGMNSNALARRFKENDYALNNLTPHPTDVLNLIESEIEVLQQTINANSPLFAEIFGSAINLNQVSRFIEATDIAFEEFRQLYRDYAVKDEAGTSYNTQQRGCRFVDGRLMLKEENGVLYMILSDGHAIHSDHLAPMNHLVRLYKRTGLAFHELDQLLCSIPAAKGQRKVTEGGFKVLAHYLYWQQQYKLNVDKYVALLTEINCWRRMGEQTEPTLMRQMFGQQAPQVTSIVLEGTTKLSDVEAVTENGITLGDILRRGLKLTRRQWEKVASLVKEDDNTALNQKTLARLYRLATVFPLFDWDILGAIELVAKIDQNLLTTLSTESDDIITEVLPALDQLTWLSQWMKTAELSVTDLLLVLTPAEEAVLQSTQEVSNWLQEFNQAIDNCLLNNESDFAIYRHWMKEDGEVIEIDNWRQQLQGKNILDNSGLVKGVGKSQITSAITDILTSAGVDNAANQALKNQLVDFLAETQSNQEQVLFEQLVKIAEDDNPEIVAPMLRWVGMDVYQALDTLLSGTESAKLQLLYDLGRHLQLTSKLSFTSATVHMLYEQPEWLVAGMTVPVSLKQIYYLERFKQLQNAEASEAMWLAYFISRWAEEDTDDEQVDRLLALLLDFNQQDIQVLREHAAGGEMKTVQQVEALSRQIQLCRDLSISATELITLRTEGVNSGTQHAAAASAVLGGLARSSDENVATLANNARNEKIRDALVAAVFSHVIAEDEELLIRKKITRH